MKLTSNRFVVPAILVALLVMALAGTVWAAPNISDVAPSHWAYQAVVKLVEEGYLELSTGNAFNGEDYVDRYTLASVVAEVLHEMEKGRLDISQEDVALLRRLTTEFSSELVSLYEENDELFARVEQLEKTSEAVKQQVYDSVDFLTQTDAQLTEEVDLLKRELQASEANSLAALSQVDGKIEALSASVFEISGAVDNLQSSVAEHSRILDANSAVLAEAIEAIVALEEILDVNVESRFQEREMALAMVRDELAAADSELLQTLQSQGVSLQELTQQVLALEDGFGTVIAEQETEITELEAQLQQAQEMLAALEQRDEAQAETIAALQKQITGYQGRIEELKAEVDLLRQRFIAVEDTVVRIGKVVTTLDEELGKDLDTNISMALQRYRVLEQDVNSLRQELNEQKARSLEEIEQLKRTNSFLMLGGGLAIILLFVMGS